MEDDMRRLRIAAAVVAACLAAGCTSKPDPVNAKVRQLPCDAAEFEPAAAVGAGVLKGQAFLKTRGGDVKYGAGEEVILVPAVDCAVEWWNLAGQAYWRRSVYPESPAFTGAVRRSTTDGEGRFAFNKLAPGRYYVRTVVTWEIPARYGTSTEGGLVGGAYDVADGDPLEVILPSL